MTTIPTIDLVDALAAEYADKSPSEILALALNQTGEIAISFSGAEDVVLIDMAANLGKPFRVFSLDTGRLHAETYQFIETVRKHYNINIEICFPEADAVQQLVNEKGLFSFYQDDHKECCGIRKVQPLRKKLATLDGWITGQRKDQSPGTRTEIPVVQADIGFSGEGKQLIKYNPLANWSSADVWSYIRMMEVPYNPLHERGFISIGCDGELITQFTDNVLVDVAGPDLYIFEVGPFVERTELAISQDGINWLEVGVIEGARSDVDINGLIGDGERYNYVRLRNAGRSCGGMHSGADIDAIAAVGAEIRLSLDSALLFDVAKFNLKPEAKTALDELLAKVAAYGNDIRVTVEGHTDSTGSDSTNKTLSLQRAQSVWDYLAPGLSLKPEQVSIKGYGASRPVASNDDEAGRALNRRVDLLIRPGQKLKR
mgnify:CR=1 FL=1